MTKEIFNSCSQAEYEEYRELLDKFDIPTGNITKIKVVKNGRINTTLVIYIMTENGMRTLTLQKINTNVFKKPVELMENVAKTTEHARKKGYVALHVNKVKYPVESKYVYYDKKTDSYWRLYDFIEAECLNAVEKAEDMQKLGEAIRDFCMIYSDFDASTLVETIPNFHNTSKRYSHFNAVLMKDLSSLGEVRSDTCKPEYEFITSHSEKASMIVDALKKGEIPYRVSHNDTKLNNVLFDKYTMKPMCMIDLDTVMPGTVLYDFGDAARYGCNTDSEEAVTTENVSFNLERFKALTEGFLKENTAITEREVKLLVDGVWMITYEQAIRFLDDHIDGNHYFGVEYDGKNLERARVQIALLKDIEAKYREMEQIVADAWQK